MSGVYWGLTAMDLMGQLERMNKEEVLKFVRSCYDSESGGFAATLHHDPHLLYTLSAVQVRLTSVPSECFGQISIAILLQVLTLYDSVSEVEVEGVVKYVASLQQQDGSFAGDKWGEVNRHNV